MPTNRRTNLLQNDHRFVTASTECVVHDDGVMRRFVFLVVVILCLVGPLAAQASWRAVPDPSARPDVPAVTVRQDIDAKTVILRTWYDTWNGHRRAMTILFPRAAENTGQVLPLLVAAHPAGGASTCVDQMATLAGRFNFVLACLDGQGDSTRAFSYGAPGQIADLAAAPNLIAGRLPGMKLDARKLYLVGSSRHCLSGCGIRVRTARRLRSIRSLTLAFVSTRFRSFGEISSKPNVLVRLR